MVDERWWLWEGKQMSNQTTFTLVRNEDDRNPVVTQVVFPDHPLVEELGQWHNSVSAIGMVLKHVIDLPWEGTVTLYAEDQYTEGVGNFLFEARVEAFLNDAAAHELVIEFNAKADGDEELRGVVVTKVQSRVPIVGYYRMEGKCDPFVIGFTNETAVAIHEASAVNQRWVTVDKEPAFNLTVPHEACALLRGLLGRSTPLSPDTGSDDLVETEEAGREFEE